MPMRLRVSKLRAWFGLAVAMLGLGQFGCGDGDFVSPPPPELRGNMGASSPSPTSASGTVSSDLLGSATTGVKSVELILAGGRDVDEIEAEKAAARMQAGADKARLKITVVGEEPSDQGPRPTTFKDQTTLVRDAIARHPQALIVDPGDPADHELARAVEEALAAKVPVVLLGRPLAGGIGGPSTSTSTTASPVLVAPESFTESARQIVDATIRNVKNAKLDLDGGAIILVNTAGDPFIPDRVAALRDALKAAGIKSVDEVRFAKDSATAQKLLTARLKADPKPTMVFSVDFMSTSATNETVGDIGQERPFIQAGYSSEDNQLRMARMGEFGALGQYIPTRLVRKAVSTAVALALKQEVHSPVVLSVVVSESPTTAGVARFQSRTKAKMRSQSE